MQKYVVFQVVLKEKLIGVGSKTLRSWRISSMSKHPRDTGYTLYQPHHRAARA